MSFYGFLAITRRDFRLAFRRPVDTWISIVFLGVSICLFPLGVGPEPQTLREIGPGIIWVCALLSSFISLNTLYSGDHLDGSLEQMLLSENSAIIIALSKITSHWILTGLPLVMASPLLGLMFDMSHNSIIILTITLLLGTPSMSLLGGIGAAITLGVRSSGALVFLLILPLTVPILIFGTGAVTAVDLGESATGQISILGSLLLLTLIGAPPATAAALNISIA